MLSQTFMPALLFVPGVSVIRTVTRIAAYLTGLVAWGGLFIGGSKSPTAGAFPARPWLVGCIVWLILCMFHPGSYSPITALGQLMLYVAIMSPAFWAGEALATPKQLGRLVAVLFLCNAASATVGVGQVFYPDRLMPKFIPVVAMNPDAVDSISIETADGRKVLRPCGLTDSPGAAAPAGAAAALLGLCLALRPLPWWRRGACVGLAFVGASVIYFAQVRASLIYLGISVLTLTGLLLLRGQVRNALSLVVGGVAVLVAAMLYVARAGAANILERFGTLVTTDPSSLYQRNRGGFVEHAFTMMGESPLGFGLGWWGMVHLAFRDPSRVSVFWVEVMFQGWAVDGGIPLTGLYCGAIAAAMFDSLRIVFTSRDPDVVFWGAVVVSLNLSVVALCFSYPVFLSPSGMQFWVLAGALHAADAQSRGGAARPVRRWARNPRPVRPAPQAV